MDQLPVAPPLPGAEPARSESAQIGRAWWAITGAGLLLVVAVLAWIWSHPNVFNSTGGTEVSNTRAPGERLYVGMTYAPQGAQGMVTIHAAGAHGVHQSAESDIAFYVCTINPAARVGAVGAVDETGIHDACSSLVPAVGATIDLGASPRRQLLMAVSLRAIGQLSVQGADLTYTYGWQRGTQVVGPDVRLRTIQR